MPRIFLKPNSPEFANSRVQNRVKICEMPGCTCEADHKAPKHRGLNEYYHFCLEHVRAYNKAWNFFEGMPDSEVEEHMYNSLYGDRPTWKYGVNGNAEDALYDQIWRSYHGEDAPERDKTADGGGQGHNRASQDKRQAPEIEAMAIMGLEPPVELKDIKARYKVLAKKYHPDLNKGCTKSEELLKQINMAYTILRLAYESYEKLPNRT